MTTMTDGTERGIAITTIALQILSTATRTPPTMATDRRLIMAGTKMMRMLIPGDTSRKVESKKRMTAVESRMKKKTQGVLTGNSPTSRGEEMTDLLIRNHRRKTVTNITEDTERMTPRRLVTQ